MTNSYPFFLFAYLMVLAFQNCHTSISNFKWASCIGCDEHNWNPNQTKNGEKIRPLLTQEDIKKSNPIAMVQSKKI
jgi:hypothetical protein